MDDWEAKKAMLVRFNPMTDLRVEVVKDDLRLSRANITFCMSFPHLLSHLPDQISLENMFQ